MSTTDKPLMDNANEEQVIIKKLDSGFYHVRGNGPCNWTQPPNWPASETEIRLYAFAQASEEFLRMCIKMADKEINTPPEPVLD